MKKIISLILILSLALSMALVFSSCKKKCKEHTDKDKNSVCDTCAAQLDIVNLAPEDFIKYDASEKYVYSPAAKNAMLQNLEYSTSNGDLLLFYGSNSAEGKIKYCAINTTNGQVVYTLKWETADAKTTSYLELSYGFIIKKTEDRSKDTTSYITTVYSSSGEEIASASGASYSYVSHVSNDYYKFDEKIYEYKDGKAKFVKDEDLVEIPSVDLITDNYLYDLSNSEILVYDKDFKLALYYAFPNNAEPLSYEVLQNEMIFVQYAELLPFDAAEYDIYEGNKYNIRSYVINPENEQKVEYDLGFLVYNITTEAVAKQNAITDFKWDYLVNVALVAKIENKTIATEYEYLNLNNELAVIANLTNTIPAQDDIPYAVSSNNYLIDDLSGKSYLVKGDGEYIGEVSNAIFQNGYFILGNKYYDTNLKLVCELDDTKYALVSSSKNYKIYRETINDGASTTYKFYTFDSGALTQIKNIEADVSNIYCYDDYFTYNTYDSAANKTYLVYCNAKGAEIMRFDTGRRSFNTSVSTYGDILIIAHTYRNDSNEYIKDYYISVLK